MATNEVFRDADHLTLPVASGVLSGAPVIVGSLVGVAQTDRAADGTATVWRKGAFRLPVAAAVATVGAAIYITSAGALNTTASGNTLFGYSLTTSASSGDLVTVAIAQV